MRGAEKEARMNEKSSTREGLTPGQQILNDLWEEHLRDEFTTQDTKATLETMVPDAYVKPHSGVELAAWATNNCANSIRGTSSPKMPADTEIVPVSRTIGAERLVDEMIFRFTHTHRNWTGCFPGIAPTGKRVECPLVVIVHFRDGKTFERAHLLGSSFGAGAVGAARCSQPARSGPGDREKNWRTRVLPSNHLIERGQGCDEARAGERDLLPGWNPRRVVEQNVRAVRRAI